MKGSYPYLFNSFEAADLTAKGYALEEGVDWTVIRKKTTKMVYKPCRVSEYDYDTKAEGWVIADD
jgi:hypothetical protein